MLSSVGDYLELSPALNLNLALAFKTRRIHSIAPGISHSGGWLRSSCAACRCRCRTLGAGTGCKLSETVFWGECTTNAAGVLKQGQSHQAVSRPRNQRAFEPTKTSLQSGACPLPDCSKGNLRTTTYVPTKKQQERPHMSSLSKPAFELQHEMIHLEQALLLQAGNPISKIGP